MSNINRIYEDTWWSETAQVFEDYAINSAGEVFLAGHYQMRYDADNNIMKLVGGATARSPFAWHCLQICRFARALGIIGENPEKDALKAVMEVLMLAYGDTILMTEQRHNYPPEERDWYGLRQSYRHLLEMFGIDTSYAREWAIQITEGKTNNDDHAAAT